MKNKYVMLGALLFSMAWMTACAKNDSGMTMNKSAKTLYHCAMHPQIVSDKPGECPICHMRLTPVLNSAALSTTDSDQNVSGQAAVRLGEGIRQEIGVAVEAAMPRDLVVDIRAAARVAYDPDLYNAALEHQESTAFLRRAKEHGSPELLEQAESTVHSSKLRLRQMGLSDEQIHEMGKPDYDASGLLLGNKDGKIWVYANVYDADAVLIHSGQEALLSSPSMPGKIYHGIVRGIDPILNADTRTLRVRIKVMDADQNLRPESYLSATIHASLGKHLSVPENAVMDTGSRQLVYVEKEAGLYVPREVQVGRRSEGYSEIISGLQDGEKVVTSANFLIDSESRIQAATLKATEEAPH